MARCFIYYKVLCVFHMLLLAYILNIKGKFLYSALSNPQDCSNCYTLYFPDRPVQSYIITASLGSIQTYVAINARRLLVHISTTVHPIMQLSELELCRMKWNLSSVLTPQHRIRNRVLLVESLRHYPWATALYSRPTSNNYMITIQSETCYVDVISALRETRSGQSTNLTQTTAMCNQK